jgi:hypothetical protein
LCYEKTPKKECGEMREIRVYYKPLEVFQGKKGCWRAYMRGIGLVLDDTDVVGLSKDEAIDGLLIIAARHGLSDNRDNYQIIDGGQVISGCFGV